jgi:WD40 repeat protein
MSAFRTRLLVLVCLSFPWLSLRGGEGPATKDKKARTDSYGDPLPEGARARLGTLRFRHNAPVRCIAFSPDGKTLATGSEDRTVRIWDTKTGKERCRLTGHAGWVDCVAFSPDGKTLVSGGDRDDVRLWDVATGRELRQFPADPKGRILALAFSPDGTTLASAHWTSADAEDLVRCWQVHTGKEIRQLTFPDRFLVAVAFSPNSKVLVTGCVGGLVSLHEVATGKRFHQLGQPTEGDRFTRGVFQSAAFAFSPDGKRLTTIQADVAGAIPVARVWDVESGRELRRIMHPENSHRCAITSDGKMFALTRGSGVQLWDLPAGKKTHLIKTERPWIAALAFSPDGKTLAIADGTCSVTLWETATGKPLFPTRGHSGEGRSVAFSPDGKTLASTGWYGDVLLWDSRQGNQTRRLERFTMTLHTLTRSVSEGPR